MRIALGRAACSESSFRMEISCTLDLVAESSGEELVFVQVVISKAIAAKIEVRLDFMF